MLSILLPTDFSENSINAIRYALEFYRDEDCKFHFLHCYPPVIFSYEYQIERGLVGKNIHDIVQGETKERLYELAISMMRDHGNGQKFDVEVVTGFLPDQVARVASDNKIDLIVMGTKGETGSDRVVFGTNTIQVINKRCCPVIAVPEGFEFNGIDNILFPSDLNLTFSYNHLKDITKVLELHQCNVNILHISFRGLTSTQRKHKALLEEAFSDHKTNFVVEDSKDVTDIIYDYQQKNKSELLVMINNKHMFFENLFFKPTISKIAMHLSTPFLVIPA
ncbi:universal stress protein [Winogradskyella tangerina]|uniref:universal stress protein n=1 Tax=Winogradskyella tangerina TaxID=2023240 RepID=UPI000DBE59D4|nr:universal stress protein [Winogradskyella tangerina]